MCLALPALAPEVAAEDDEGEMSDECRAFRSDPEADLGDVMRAGCEPTLAQMSALMDNPLGNVAMWFNQVDWYRLNNDQNTRVTQDQINYMGIFQFPYGVSEDWNIINRVIYNVGSVPLDVDDIGTPPDPPGSSPPGGGPIQPPSSGGPLPIDLFSGTTNGFGDMYYVGLASPKKAIKHEGGGSSVWGVGLDVAFPTATDDVLGTGRWAMGPSALYAYLGPDWKLGALVQTYFGFAGENGRDETELLNIQAFYYYSLNETTSMGAGPVILANFEADSRDTWTVPVGIGINRTFQLGKLPVRLGFEYYYSLERPDTVGIDHSFRFFVIPAVPSALLPKWIQGR
jgi:hypothetical protein